MNRRRVEIAAGAVLIALGLTMKGALAANTPCGSTAWNLWRACKIDAREELHVTRANCANIADGDARAECRDEADAARAETAEECDEIYDARRDVCDLLGEFRYDPDPLLDPAIEFVHPDTVDENSQNPYVSVVAGNTFVLRSEDETVVVHATEDTREINGVPCRVVLDVVVEAEEAEGAIEYEPVEVTADWFAQDTERNVYYCGELSRDFEDGVIVTLDGSFQSGREFAKGGVLTRAFPIVGEAHRQEYALDEAEDVVQYLDLAAVPTEEMGGENAAFPCAPEGCLQTFDLSALDPSSTEFKFYKAGVGFVLAVALEDGEITGEREELVCTGSSLAILHDDRCGIENPDALLDTLCELSSEFCDGAE